MSNYDQRDILKKSGFKCVYCNHPLTERTMQVDHVIPKSKGGKDTLDNLVAACPSCNIRKSDKTLDEWSKPNPYELDEEYEKRLEEWELDHKKRLAGLFTLKEKLDRLSMRSHEYPAKKSSRKPIAYGAGGKPAEIWLDDEE